MTKPDPGQPALFDLPRDALALDLASTASCLGVSTATIRNWVRAGLLKPLGGGRAIEFSVDHIQEVQKRLESGAINRLQTRANKKASRATFIPEEYCVDSLTSQTVSRLVQRYENAFSARSISQFNRKKQNRRRAATTR